MGVYKSYSNEKPHKDAKLVHFSNYNVTIKRYYTLDYLTAAIASGTAGASAKGLIVPTISEGTAYLGATGRIERPRADWYSRELRDDHWSWEYWETYMDSYDATQGKPEPAETDFVSGAVQGDEEANSMIVELEGNGFTAKHDRDWTWITFDNAPADDQRVAFELLGFRYSAKRSSKTESYSYYVRETVDLVEVDQALTVTVEQEATEEQVPVLAPEQPQAALQGEIITHQGENTPSDEKTGTAGQDTPVSELTADQILVIAFLNKVGTVNSQIKTAVMASAVEHGITSPIYALVCAKEYHIYFNGTADKYLAGVDSVIARLS